jgi:predicted nicotinamide N-methyase
VASSARAFVARHTRLRPVPGLPDLRLHLADEVLPLWRAVQVETGDPDAALPYWAFAWAGGLAIARWLREHPEAVSGKRVLDIATGSGLCAIAARQAGAGRTSAADVDRFAAAAAGLNARANAVRLSITEEDLLDAEAPEVDVILAGDCLYEEPLAARILPWLSQAHRRGVQVFIGDPGRRYLPAELHAVVTYEVRTTTELEDLERKRASVYRFGD